MIRNEYFTLLIKHFSAIIFDDDNYDTLMFRGNDPLSDIHIRNINKFT